eukprot:scaffold3666_cov160-Amphora_coffeaeformis.AAC.19
MCVGAVDSRNVWKVQPEDIITLVDALKPYVSNIRVQASGSLPYLPWDFECEKELQTHPAGCVLAFAKQKLQEIKVVAKAFEGDKDVLKDHQDAWRMFKSVVSQEPETKYIEEDLVREELYAQRRPKQLVGVRVLPTTTIGSFPQAPAIRRLRTQWRKGGAWSRHLGSRRSRAHRHG